MIKLKIQKLLNKVVLSAFGLENGETKVALTENPLFGDYTTNIALQLSKLITKKDYQSPRAIANMVVELLSKEETPFLERIEIAGPGFINFYLKPKDLVADLHQAEMVFDQIGQGKKVLLEHTSVNPNKAMHIGHLRNAIIGDSLARILKRVGFQVEIQNYIDDTGVQVVDTYIALKHKDELGLRPKRDNEALDDYYWEAYATVNRKYQEDPEFLKYKPLVLAALEDEDSIVAKDVKQIAQSMVKATEKTLLERFDIVHDLYIWESDILRCGFWDQAFEILKLTSGFEQEKTGPNKGTWLVRVSKKTAQSKETEELAKQEGSDERSSLVDVNRQDKIFVRSDGTTTYIAKDFAYNLWKFGLLGKDFKYIIWDDLKTHKIYSSDPTGVDIKGFGKGDLVYTLIDERQSYLQQVLLECFQKLGYQKQAQNFKHVSYGVVSLSKATASSLGLDVSEEKSSYSMSGRKGVGVEVKKLHDLLTEKAASEKAARKDTSSTLTSSQFAASALKYFLLKFNSATEIVFDFEQALSIYGATGPYLQYSYARVSSILEKAKDFAWDDYSYEPDQDELFIIKLLLEWPDVLKDAAIHLEPSNVATYTYTLAQKLNNFYETHRVMGADSKDEQLFRLGLLKKAKIILSDTLDTLGIIAPERM